MLNGATERNEDAKTWFFRVSFANDRENRYFLMMILTDTSNEQTTDVIAGSATSRAFTMMRARILKGEFLPGEKLKVDELRQQLAIGASPIREALSLLTSAHLVERIDQRGFRVTPVSRQGFDELLKTRCWLEERALRESMAAASQDWEEGLVLAHHRLARSERHQPGSLIDHGEWERLHRRFHQALIAGCGSSILLRFCDELYDQNVRYRHVAGAGAGYQKRDIEAEHSAIATAALTGDADRAVAALVGHYQQTGEYLRQLLD